jgi:preprotein translocase subunit SecG
VLFADGWSWLPPTLNALIIVIGVFMILLVLIQRGKGGGLAGAFGGVGGSSAFGSRAGDTFTRVTIITAAVWILLIMILSKAIQPPRATTVSANRSVPAGPAEPESDQ